jgi:hypothetical protein
MGRRWYPSRYPIPRVQLDISSWNQQLRGGVTPRVSSFEFRVSGFQRVNGLTDRKSFPTGLMESASYGGKYVEV